MEQKKQSMHKIILYLCYTFSITWSCWLLIIICNTYFNTLWYGTPLFWIPYMIGSLSPAISAYLIYRKFRKYFVEKSFMQYVFFGKLTVKVWFIFGLFLAWRFFMIWISFGIHQPISILAMLINLPLLVLLGGLEELGWRGFLQPQLEKITNYLPSILLVGTIWSLWHLPLWFMKGAIQSEFSFGLYLASSIVLTASFTTLYKYTNNLFLCILSHAWFNGCINLALYADNHGSLQLDLNWKVLVVFAFEFIISIILGISMSKKVKKNPLAIEKITTN